MKTLYIDCAMGAAGDMLTAALIELFEQKEKIVDEINGLGIPGVSVFVEDSVKCGIKGTHFTVKVHGEEESENIHTHNHSEACGYTHEHSHDHNEACGHTHEHSHDHTEVCEHTHAHTDMHDIEHIVNGLSVNERVKSDILSVYTLIAEAESHAHGVPVTDIHFHEVGTMDAVADIAAVCVLMDKITPDRVIASPVHVGCGQVKCMHGILPVPAPATAHILCGVPMYGGKISGELCTPTGAALLKHFVTEFGDMPVMKVRSVGYGMGKKDFEAANCVRAMLGETDDNTDTIVELTCNLDDMTPEAIAFAGERFFESGAVEVYSTPIQMKKSRPGVLLSVMCREKDRDSMIKLIFKHTTTLGVRENISRRYTLSRRIETVQTRYGEVRKKISTGYGAVREKTEYEDIAQIARSNGLSLEDVLKSIIDEE